METLSPELKRMIGENAFQFYRCYKCGDLISAMELAVALGTNGIACGCGSMQIQPTQVRTADYTRRNVVEMAVHLDFSEEDYMEDFARETGEPMTAEQHERVHRLWTEAKAALCS
jgi:hypothetical protein